MLDDEGVKTGIEYYKRYLRELDKEDEAHVLFGIDKEVYRTILHIIEEKVQELGGKATQVANAAIQQLEQELNRKLTDREVFTVYILVDKAFTIISTLKVLQVSR